MPGYARPPRPRGAAGPLIAGLSGLLAAGLVLGGSFPAIHVLDRGDSKVVVGWWGVEGVDLVGEAASLRGLPLVLAFLLLGTGAILAFVRQSTATRLLLALGVGSLAGTVFLQVIATMHDLNASNQIELAPGESIQFVTGWGLWLPMAGILVGAVALIFAYRVPRAGAELSTPRMGFPMPYPPPMTGVQPAVPGGQPVPAAPVVPVPGAAAAVPASPSDDDPETTLRTKVTEEPVAPDAPTEAPEPETPDVPTKSAEAPIETADVPEAAGEPGSTPPSEPDTAKTDDPPAAPPAAEATPEPTAEPTPEPIAEPAAEPTAEPTAEATPEPIVEPIAEATPEPPPEPTPETAAEQTAEPAEPVAEPAAEPTPESAGEDEPKKD
jgi:hypothetical protein